MNTYSTGHYLAFHAGMPKQVLAHLTTTVYRSAKSAGGKYHMRNKCGHIRTSKSVWLSPVTVDAASVPESRLCICMPSWAPEDWRPVLEGATQILTLLDAARRVNHADRYDNMVDLDHVSLVLTGRDRLESVTVHFLDLLHLSGAGTPAMTAARNWLNQVRDEVWAAHAIAQTMTDQDPEREYREGALAQMDALDNGFTADRFPALAKSSWKMDDALLSPARASLREALIASGDLDAAREAALAVIEGSTPATLDQVPAIPVEAAGNLRDLVTSTWRTAAREQLGILVDLRLTEFSDALARREPVLLVLEHDEDGDPLSAQLEKYPHHRIDEESVVYLVPHVIGAGVGQTSRRVQISAAPIPEDLLPLAAAGLEAAADSGSPVDLTILWSSAYVTTLLAMLEHMCGEEAITAALGVVHAA